MFLPQEVAALVSPREFTKLCKILDDAYGKTVVEVSNPRTDTPKAAERKLAVKFDVLAIERSEKHLFVTVCAERHAGAVRVTVK